MNHRIYLFGVLGDGYTQYPSDYTQDYFTEFAQSIHAKTAICVKRDGDIMFYQYIRRLEDKGQYMGIAIAYNGVMINDIAPLFQLCEDAITNLVVNGQVLEFTDNGTITTRAGQLYKLNAEFVRISEYLAVQLNTLVPSFEKIPPQNYALGKDASKSFSIQDDMETIVEATRNYAKVYIIKEHDYDTESLSSFSAKLQRLNHSKEQAEKTAKKLKTDLATLKRKQKNLKLVLLLFFVLIVGVIVFAIYAEQSNNTIGNLTTQNTEQANTIDEQKSTIDSLTEDINRRDKRIETLTADTLRLYRQNGTLIHEKDEVDKKLLSANVKIKQLEKANQDKQKTITNLQNQLQANSRHSSSTSNTSNTQISGSNNVIGPSISRTTQNYDNNYALWLHISRPIRINSFYVMANKTGKITIGLYNSAHKRIYSYRADVTANAITKITPNFRVSESGDYYLAIEKSNNIELSYHSAASSEYDKYKSDAVQIVGIAQKRKNCPNTHNGNYRYFYYISYTIL